MGIQILATGLVHVLRTDREWLRRVPDGLLQYEELLEIAADNEGCLRHLCATGPLPDEPDTGSPEGLVTELQEQHLWLTRRST